MPTLTHNLFWGRGETDHRLRVVEGHWPTDLSGSVFVVGPDKRRPGGHWFGEAGLLCRIECEPDRDGRIAVQHRLIDTPVNRLHRRLPFLFAKVGFLEISPFGVTNFANTNVQPIDDRLFVGYDAGRPVEVDPDTLRHITPVGANDEWLQGMPGTVEPLVAVAAHPAPDFEERALYFLNYLQIPLETEDSTTFVARWDLEGAIERWPLVGMSPFDSLHDVKATRDYLVFSDLPFVVEPGSFRGAPRERANQDFTQLWVVRKADLRNAPGTPVEVREVRIPMPTGHLSVDYENPDGQLRVFLQHMPLSDLMIAVTPDERDHASGNLFDPNYEGLVTLATQPSVLGRYLIDGDTGEVSDADVTHDDRFWGGMLAAQDTYRPAALAHQRNLVFAGIGYDPELIPESWWTLYGDGSNECVVPPADLPPTAKPGALAHYDLEGMKLDEVFEYADGAFPSPPTFVPRAGSDEPDDGYVIVIVHQDGPKEVQVFDAQHPERGPLARATGPDFSPPLLLHSCWMPAERRPRRTSYRIPLRRDVSGALKDLPRHLRTFRELGEQMRRG